MQVQTFSGQVGRLRITERTQSSSNMQERQHRTFTKAGDCRRHRSEDSRFRRQLSAASADPKTVCAEDLTFR